MKAQHTPIWPDTLKLRDTGLHDDLGGLGQRIYTTAGAGYEKREYVRSDLAAAAPELLAELSDILRSIKGGGDVVTFSAADIARYEALIAKATGSAA